MKHTGAARWAYNWGLARKIEAIRSGARVPTAIDLHRELNSQKRSTYPWLYEVSKCAPQEALRNLDRAFAYFYGHSRARRARFPRFKSRKHGIGGFRLTGSIRVEARDIWLPRLGRLRLKERGYLPTGAHLLSASVSERAGRWFVSVLVEAPHPAASQGLGIVGLDLGLSRLVVSSDGMVFEHHRAATRFRRRIGRLQKAVSRKKRGSANRRRARAALARAYATLANVRQDSIHKITTQLTRDKSCIVIEDLSSKGMMKRHTLAGALADASFRELRRQLTYKCEWYGVRLIVAPRAFPSTRMCSACGNVGRRLDLGLRVYRCEACGLLIDRDLNAARNLAMLAVSSTDTKNACRESGSLGTSRAALVEAGIGYPVDNPKNGRATVMELPT